MSAPGSLFQFLRRALRRLVRDVNAYVDSWR